MAHLVLQSAFGVVHGISVDTHVHRISGRLGWTKGAATPGKTADQLEAWVPFDRWRRVNGMLVGFGQTVCKPIGPRCYECQIRKLCPMKGKTPQPSASRAASLVNTKRKRDADDSDGDDSEYEEKGKKKSALEKLTETKRVKK